MRILVLATAASSGGAMTILESLWEFATGEHASSHQWVFVLSDRYFENGDRVRVHIEADAKRSWFRRLRFELVTGADLVERHDPDVVLTLQNTLPVGLKRPTVVYLHQPLPFQAEPKYRLTRKAERQLAIYQKGIGRLIKNSVARADLTVVQTNWMRKAVCEQVGLSGDRIVVIPPQLPELQEFADTYTHDSRRFVYPTSEVLYKNNDVLLDACRRLSELGFTDLDVVMTLDRQGSTPLTTFAGRMKRVALLRLMSTSTLVFPSITETYGLPLAEARAIGALVLAADRPYAREVLFGYRDVHFFDPDNSDELAQLMADVRLGRLKPVGGDHRMRGIDPQGDLGWAAVEEIMEKLIKGQRPHGA